MITLFYKMAFILNILCLKEKVITLCRCLTCRPCWLGLPFSFRSHLYYNIFHTTINTDIKVIWLLVKIAVGIHLYTGRGEDYCKVEAPRSAGSRGTTPSQRGRSIEVPSNATFCFAVYCATGGGKVQVCQIIKVTNTYHIERKGLIMVPLLE